MRVTIVSMPVHIGGGQRVIATLAAHLHRRGHQVVVVSPLPPRFTARHIVRSLVRGQGWPRHDTAHHFGPEIDLRRLDRYRPVAAADLPDADAVVATWWETAEWVAALPPSKGAKVYFLQQLESNFGAPADRVAATWRLPLRKVVCSSWLADLARDRFGDPDAAVVPNGVDPDLFHAPPRGKQPVPTVGFLYFPGSPAKGTPTALAVLEAVRRRLPDLKVRAFGLDGPHPDHPLPPGGEYTRSPAQTALRHIYAGCDVWLCTSTSEGFHLPPHEAMACRCPVVSTPVGGPTDLVEQGVNGYLAPVGDVDRLAGHVTDVLVSDEGRWRVMSDAALATALRYTWDEATDRFERALEAACPAAGGPVTC